MKNTFIDFLNLGMQPLANSYIESKNINKKERKYSLIIRFNKNNKLVSIKNTFSSKDMFNDQYPYRSSTSKTMSLHLKKLAQIIGTMFNKQVKINKYSNKDVDCYVPNINKAKKKLKLKINYDLKESINLTINNNYEKVN